MALIPVIGGTSSAAHPYVLTVGGLDVTKEGGGAGGTLFGTRLETVTIVEDSMAVSSISFTIDDPFIEVQLLAGQEIVMWWGDTALFRGYVDTWASVPAFGMQGRSISVVGVGIEAWLDWMRLPVAYSVAALSTPSGSASQALALAPCALNVRANTGGVGTGLGGTSGGWGQQASGGSSRAGTIAAGTTLRETLTQIAALGEDRISGIFVGGIDIIVVVDFYSVLRVWPNFNTPVALYQPGDYATLTVSTAGPIRAENLSYEVDPSDVDREVVIVGGSVAGSGVFGDGSGIRGPQGLITDTSITTEDVAFVTAQNYLVTQAGTVRGTFDITDFTPATNVHVGSLLDLTDAVTGATSISRIFQIEKTFTGSRQNWKVSFGGRQRSLASLARRLTRTLS